MNEEQLKNWMKKRKAHKDELSSDALISGILKGHVPSLSSAITLLESSRKEDREEAAKIVQACLHQSGNAIRIGITGVPGVGKSTFIESFGQHIISLGFKVAVLAVDPSSEKSGGSILGDKTRMQNLSQDKNAFIRPSAAGDSLGGVARKTRESIFLCEAAGFDVILIETVGVGQSETVVHSMVDFFLLLMLAGAGDELQGIKRGIMEMADALVITKTDGDNVKKANVARLEYKNALHLFPPNENEWIPKAMTCSAVNNTDIDRVWNTIESYQNQTKINGWFTKTRKKQDSYWMNETLKELLLDEFYRKQPIKDKIQLEKDNIEAGRKTSFQSAEDIFKFYKENRD